MFERALAEYPVATQVVLGVVCLIVVVLVALAMDKFIGWGLEEDDARRPHAFNPNHPSHCTICWREGQRRRAEEIERASRDGAVPFRAGQWPRV